MKKLILSLVTIITITLSAFAQGPEGFNYQAAVRNASGDLIINQNIGVQVKLLEGSDTGTIVFAETWNVNTNNNGIFNLIIGNGTNVSGDLESLDWGNVNYFIEIAVDDTGGIIYAVMGTTQLSVVPVAMTSLQFEEQVGNTDVIQLAQDVAAQALNINGTPSTIGLFTSTSAIGDSQISDNGNTVIIGTGSTNGNLNVLGNLNYNGNLISNGNGNLFLNSWDVYTDSNVFNLSESGVASRLSILSGGNVGIGTETPTQALDVLGNINASDALYLKGDKVVSNDGFGRLEFFDNIGNEHLELNQYFTHFSGTNVLIDNDLMLSQKLGIGNGSNNPTATLDVMGTVKIVDGTEGAAKILTSDANGNASWQTVPSANQLVDADNNTKIQVEENTNDDTIRFDLAGVEKWVMTQNRLEPENSGNSVFIGFLAGNSDDLSDNKNVAIGHATLLSNTSGQYNTAIGAGAMRDNSTGSYNSALGLGAQQSIQEGEYNTSSGANSLYVNGNGSGNSAFGYSSLYSNTGSNNTGVGSSSGDSLLSGSNNTFLGFATNTSVSNGLENATAIGANTIVGQSNALILGNNADVGIGTSTPTAKLHVVGTVKIANGTEGIAKVLTSDIDGNATWQTPVAGSIADGSITEAKLAFDTATQTELDLKADLSGAVFTGDVSAVNVNASNNLNASGSVIVSGDVLGTNIQAIGGNVSTNNIVESTTDSGVTIDNVLIKDDKVTTSSILIADGAGTAGYVLTATDTQGNAAWQAINAFSGDYNDLTNLPSGTTATGLESLNEGNGNGHRLIGRNPLNFGSIGLNAVDLSANVSASTTTGAVGDYSIVMGYATTATEFASTAMGYKSIASGTNSTAIGNESIAQGFNATAIGVKAVASGNNSIAIGLGTRAQSSSGAAFGRYNVGGGNPTSDVLTDPLFEIGNGGQNNNRSNALTVLRNGTITAPSFDMSEITDNKALITKEYADANYNETVFSGDYNDLSNIPAPGFVPDGSITEAKLAFNTATQTELDVTNNNLLLKANTANATFTGITTANRILIQDRLTTPNLIVANGAGTAGHVLVSTDTQGTVEWQSPSSVTSPTYTIGLNPAVGGYIFWVSPDGKHGLVAATSDTGFGNWFEVKNQISIETSYSTASGGRNFRDWRLPTEHELTQMQAYQSFIGGFGPLNYVYWSATENIAGQASGRVMIQTNGNPVYVNKADIYRARAVRSF